MTRPLYLRDTAIVEPLYHQWYAWSYLLPPASASMFVANSHVKLMESFVANPQIHAAALADPAMRGGPFIACKVGRVADVARLLARTKERAKATLELAEAIRELQKILSTEATGFSLEPLYPRVPAALRGYVELTYDLENRPSVRFFENLLYRSKYYDVAAQSLRMTMGSNASRGFSFSTPRLGDPGDLAIGVPFRAPAIDVLQRARFQPQAVEAIAEALQLRGDDVEGLGAFFTDVAPRPLSPFSGAGLRVRYFGHASILVEHRGVSILTDPLPGHGEDSGADRFTDHDLPPVIDYVVITHNHQDHCMLEALLELRHRIKTVVVPRSSGGSLHDPLFKSIFHALGFENVVELAELESLEIPGGRITALPFLGEHADLDVRAKSGFGVTLDGKTLLFLADSNNLEPELYAHVRPLFEDVDTIFVGMECVGAPMTWAYGPLFSKPISRKMDQTRRLDGSDADKAIGIVRAFAPRRVYVYAMGQEPWLSHVMAVAYTETSVPIVESNKLVAHCRNAGIAAERLFMKKELVIA